MAARAKGLSDEKAARMMVALRGGGTLNKFGVKAPWLEAHFNARGAPWRRAKASIRFLTISSKALRGGRRHEAPVPIDQEAQPGWMAAHARRMKR